MANVCELNRYQIYREIKLHGKLQHENIITLYGAFKQGNHVRPGALGNRLLPLSAMPAAAIHSLVHVAPKGRAFAPSLTNGRDRLPQVVMVQEYAETGDLFHLLHK